MPGRGRWKQASSSSSLAATATAKSVHHGDHTVVNGSGSPHELTDITNGGSNKEVAAANLLLNHKAEEMNNGKDENNITSPTGASIDLTRLSRHQTSHVKRRVRNNYPSGSLHQQRQSPLPRRNKHLQNLPRLPELSVMVHGESIEHHEMYPKL